MEIDENISIRDLVKMVIKNPKKITFNNDKKDEFINMLVKKK